MCPLVGIVHRDIHRPVSNPEAHCVKQGTYAYVRIWKACTDYAKLGAFRQNGASFVPHALDRWASEVFQVGRNNAANSSPTARLGEMRGRDMSAKYQSRAASSCLRRLASEASIPPYFRFQRWKVLSLSPSRRQSSEILVPASCSFRTPTICSVVNLVPHRPPP